ASCRPAPATSPTTTPSRSPWRGTSAFSVDDEAHCRVAQERAVVGARLEHVARARADRDHDRLALAGVERVDGDERSVFAFDADEEQAPPGQARRLARGPHFADHAAADHAPTCTRVTASPRRAPARARRGT